MMYFLLKRFTVKGFGHFLGCVFLCKISNQSSVIKNLLLSQPKKQNYVTDRRRIPS
jgi:hypothetical protein